MTEPDRWMTNFTSIALEQWMWNWTSLSYLRLEHCSDTRACPFTTGDWLYTSSLSWASSIQSIPSHPTSWRSTLILSSYLRLSLPSGLFPSGFPTKTLYTPLLYPHMCYMPRPSHSSILSPEQYWVRSTDRWANHSKGNMYYRILNLTFWTRNYFF